jgi:excisionase family DNA binding protein
MLRKVKDLAAQLNVAVKTVWRWIRQGDLHAIRVGRHYRIDDDLALYLASRRT